MFKLIRQEEIKSLELEFFEFEHVKTKARHYHLKADDIENSFACGIRTNNNSSNGVAHILEHTCLAGSRDFPIKDPFFGLIKKSLNTFLNAMTSTVWTSYPFASANKKDFFNLMQVTSNATFFPTLKKEAFMQEGWRYEFAEPENAESDLTYKGVVFNEMKGYYSDSNRLAFNALNASLYPDTIYSNDSGGNPQNIPDLSYEEFKAFHKKFYHPSNAIFLSYGDIDYAEIHENLEKLVLNEFDYSEIDASIKSQTPFTQIKNVEQKYPNKIEGDDSNSYLKAFNVSDISKVDEDLTLSFLSSLLGGNESSPLKVALNKAKLAKSIQIFSYTNAYDTFLCIKADGLSSDKETLAKIDSIVEKTISDIITNGFDKDLIKRELHLFEIEQKTMSAGYGTYGLGLLLDMLDSAVFNDKVDPINTLLGVQHISTLKDLIEQPNYLENFLQKSVLDNKFAVNLSFIGDAELAKQQEKDQLDKLATIKANLTEDEKQEIINNFHSVEAFQNSNDNLDILPDIGVEDLNKEPNILEVKYDETTINKKVFAMPAPTNGICYSRMIGFINGIKASDLPYVELYQYLSNYLGYNDLDYIKATNKVFDYCQYLTVNFSFYPNIANKDEVYLGYSISSKSLNHNIKKVAEITDDVINNLRLDEKDQIIKKLKELALSKEKYIDQSAPLYATLALFESSRALTRINQACSGVEYSKFVVDLAKNIENDDVYENLINKLKYVNKLVSESKAKLYIANTEDKLAESIKTFDNDRIVSKLDKEPIILDLKPFAKNILLTDTIDVNHCFMGFTLPDYHSDSAQAAYLMIAANIISSEYAHKVLREKAGAYGGHARYNHNSGSFYISTYRDPNISKTFESFNNTKNWLAETDCINQENVDLSIMQLVTSIDAPDLKLNRANVAVSREMSETDINKLTKLRSHILNAKAEDVRKAINETLIPGFKNADFAAVVNKDQYEKECKDFNYSITTI